MNEAEQKLSEPEASALFFCEIHLSNKDLIFPESYFTLKIKFSQINLTAKTFRKGEFTC